jgi:type I restriction enzyme S subunit
VNGIVVRSCITYYLSSQSGRTEIELHTSTSAGQFTISGEGLRDIAVVLPPLPEQQAIADYLDETCAAIDAMVTEKEALISDLEAYKKSLIYDTVTGKREVA